MAFFDATGRWHQPFLESATAPWRSVGAYTDGLVHVSKIANERIENPEERTAQCFFVAFCGNGWWLVMVNSG